jgi:hypothetical protein
MARLANLTRYCIFPFSRDRETGKTRTDIFARSESHFPQNPRKKNCETRFAVNPGCQCPVPEGIDYHVQQLPEGKDDP